ncbi:MAG TPA: FAD-dependent oxidoreductase [Armatimonadota bacterium]|nr:FAD-dependent oxidoreductase [Armatimonadota bacterium]
MTDERLLHQPGRIGPLELPNRTMLAPMGSGYADESGNVTDQLIAYHVARAEGGVGLNITEHTAVAPGGLTQPTMLALYDDSHIDGFRRLCEAVHQAGGRIAVQLNHGGRQADPEVVGELVAPSEHAHPSGAATARALTTGEVETIVEQYAQAAARAKAAGVDGLEVHLAHGYLGCSFMSPLTNRRSDRYGGDTSARCQFAREVFARIRELCGDEMALWCRISADEFMDGGMTLDEAKLLAPMLVEAGAQAIHVSGCVGETAAHAAASYYAGRPHLAHLAAGIREVVDVPVIAVGRILTPAVAEALLRREACDFVALGRPLLADHAWAAKARDGREVDIVPCIACNIGCLTRRAAPVGLLQCTTNPRTGREHEWSGAPARADAAQHVLVIGGGPAGMSAAAASADAGHRVTLWEADEELGGAYRLACLPPGKDDLRAFLKFQIRRLQQLGVAVTTGGFVTAAMVADLAPATLIIATGARRPSPPEFAGAIPAEEAIRHSTRLGAKVAIVGGGRAGTEVAHFLAERGHEITLIDSGDEIASEVASGARVVLMGALDRLGAEVLTDTRALRAERDGLIVSSPDGAERSVGADTVVLAIHREPEDALVGELTPSGVAVHVIGDAREPRSAQEAVFEGAEVARLISLA